MRDSTILRELMIRDRTMEAQTDQVVGLGRAVERFMEMGFVDRIGWTLFGARFLVWRWMKRSPKS